MKPRDVWIGWSDQQRQRNLQRIVGTAMLGKPHSPILTATHTVQIVIAPGCAASEHAL